MVATTPRQTPYLRWYQRWDLPILLPGVLMALTMVWSVVQSIAISGWADGLDVLISVALPAVIIGVIFARLHWLPAWLAHLLSTALGIAWAVQCVGPLLVSEIAGEFGATSAARLTSWTDRATEILIRSISLTRILQAGGRGEDIVLFIVALALLVWALGYTTSWLLFRLHWTWWAIVLNGITILVNYTFASPKPNTLFFLFLGVALLLVAHQHVVQQQQHWQSSLMEYPQSISWRFLIAAVLFCGVIVLITSLLPSEVSSAQVARVWQVVSSPFTVARESWEVAFSTINAPPGTNGGGFTTRSVRVGGGRLLGNALVMRVRSSEYDYWRAVTFDKYTGRGWESTVGERARAATNSTTAEQARTAFDTNAIVPQTDILDRKLVTQTVELAQDRPDSLLFVGGQLARAGIPVLIQHGYLNNGEREQPNFDEISAIYSQLPLQATKTYTLTALVSTADIQSLRGAGTNYPTWITDSYLELPDTVTARTRALAHQIVTEAGATNPYDQAVAIQNYLRRFVYDETRPAPPNNRDWVDYFLFDSQRGYCDDFASAMVVLLRSLNVPTRWVQGYAGGTLDDSGTYLVNEGIAHSWPEVYFPHFGWQRFEPTPAAYANVPVRANTPGANTSDISSTSMLTPTGGLSERQFDDFDQPNRQNDPEALRRALEAQAQAERQRQILIAGVIILILGVGAALFWLSLRRQEQGLSPVATLYLRLSRLAGWAGLPQKSHLTPLEYANELGRTLPTQRKTIDRVIDAYVTERYSLNAPVEPGPPIKEWQTLRRSLLIRMLTRFRSVPKQRPKRRRSRM